MLNLYVLAAEGLPADDLRNLLGLPIGILIFLGSIYLLLRANLGTRRGYYVFGTALFGYLFILGLFWGLGAPGTPQATGPTNLPGQPANELLPKWIPFAQDSLIAEMPAYSLVRDFPEGFEPVEDAGFDEDLTDRVETGVSDIQEFFADEDHGAEVGDVWAVDEEGGFPLYTYSPDTGQLIIAVRFLQTDPDNPSEVLADGDEFLGFAFFDEGMPLLPSFIVVGVSLALFLLHLWLLDRDEQRERRELAEVERPERERVPAGA